MSFLRRPVSLALITLILCLLLYVFLPDSIPDAGRRVLAVFVFALIFWSFEIIPVYATSLIVVLLLTFLLTQPGGVLGLGKTGYHLFLIPFSNPAIILFLGGFVLAAAIRKYHIDFLIIRKVLTKIGTRSHLIVLVFLFMGAFFSMWISNTAATAMMLALVGPLLVTIDEDDPMRKGIVLASAFGANIGGIATPIGTPPNAIAIGILAEHGIEMDFIGWMIMALPLAIIILAFIALILFFLFPPKAKHVSYGLPPEERLTKQGWFVVAIALFMILCWLTNPLHNIPEALIALMGVCLFAAFQLITPKDIKAIDWDILILMWGGLALGEALKLSGLIDSLVGLPFILKHGIGLIVSFSLLAMLLSTFISNTATANFLLPIAVTLGTFDKTYLSVTVALACSFGLAFPISTPPNAMAYSTGVLKTSDMFKAGALASIFAMVLLLLVYDMMIPWAFRIPK